ncbi:hypothetical protein DFH28DRAFT_1020334 [Melampsora americana]|nr:hypothetical protein DFH28DRAFT_1020334 [Melampsora americana]
MNEHSTTTTTSTSSKKQCFTKGLMDRLKARSKIVRSPTHQSKLPIFIWESPPLGKVYKITFLARLEDDGEEGLGFRFDDTLSEVPRRLVWGGTVGTTESPGCFLDGSQTFLTDSASKPSDRCRKGWHVRIGKVSQILKAFEDVEDSLVMKVSLRKLDPSSQLTNLTTTDSNQPTIPHPALHSTKSPARRPLPLTPVVSVVNSTAQQTPPQTPSKIIDQAPPLTPKPAQVTVQSPMPKPAVTSIPPTTPSHSRTSLTIPAVAAPASPPSTPSLQKSDVIPTEVSADSADMPVTPESMPSPSSVDNSSPEPSPDVIPEPHPVSEPVVVTEETQPVQSNSTPNLEADTTLAPPMDDQAESSDPVDVQGSENTVACFVFPNRTQRPPKKMYIKLERLQGIEHFKKLLEGSATDLEIPSRYPPLRALLRTITKMFGSLIGPWMHRANFRAQAVLNRAPTIGRMFWFTREYLLPSMTRVLIGLAKLIGSGLELILEELITLVENIWNSKDQDLMLVKRIWIMTTLGRIRIGLKYVLECWKSFKVFLLGGEEWDEEEVIESLCENSEECEMADNPEIRGMVVINDASYTTYKALADYLEHRPVKFAPLRSRFECQKALLVSTVGLGTFPSDYRTYLHSRLNGQQTCCDARKLYKLSNELKLNDLKGLAQEHIMKNVSKSNVRYELKKAQELGLEEICEKYSKLIFETDDEN